MTPMEFLQKIQHRQVIGTSCRLTSDFWFEMVIRVREVQVGTIVAPDETGQYKIGESFPPLDKLKVEDLVIRCPLPPGCSGLGHLLMGVVERKHPDDPRVMFGINQSATDKDQKPPQLISIVPRGNTEEPVNPNAIVDKTT